MNGRRRRAVSGLPSLNVFLAEKYDISHILKAVIEERIRQ
jgi:hypothetical protein